MLRVKEKKEKKTGELLKFQSRQSQKNLKLQIINLCKKLIVKGRIYEETMVIHSTDGMIRLLCESLREEIERVEISKVYSVISCES